MLDLLGKEGEKVSAELGKEFSPDNILFSQCDVTDESRMVRRRGWGRRGLE